MGIRHFYIDLLLSILMFVIIGIILGKSYDKKDCLKAATLLAVYSLIILILEQTTQYFNIYNIGFSLFLYLPIEIFIIITSLLARKNSIEIINWIYMQSLQYLYHIYLYSLQRKTKVEIALKILKTF